MDACVRGDLEEARQLLGEACQVDAKGRTALMRASALGYEALVSLLLEKEARIRARDGSTALMAAAAAGHVRCVELLAQEEAGMQNNAKKTALMIALGFGHEEAALALVEREAGLADERGMTGLMEAAARGYLKVVRALMPREAGMVGNGKETAAELAVGNFQTECAAALLQDEREGGQIPAQMRAAFAGDVRELLRMRPTWFDFWNYKLTALDFALAGRHARCARLLLREKRTCNFFGSSRFDFQLAVGDCRAVLREFLPVFACQEERLQTHEFLWLALGGKAGEYLLTPFGGLVPCEYPDAFTSKCQPQPARLEKKLWKAFATVLRDKELLDIYPECRAAVRARLSSNPLFAKQIALGDTQRQGSDARKDIVVREFRAESAFNRLILIEARDVCWKAMQSQRNVQNQRAHPIRGKVCMSRMRARDGWRLLRRIVKAMLEE